jgi:predicted transcriptional regulator
MDNETLINLASDIVSAHVSNNSVAVHDLPLLIQSVYQALVTVGEPEPVVEEKREPAVSARASVKPDAVTCMECGFSGKMLKRHLSTEHGLTPQEYRARWNLSADHPMVAPNYAAQRAELAKSIGLGRKMGEKVVAKGGRKKLKVAVPAADGE